ncbi:glycosyltransferase family 9 protein [Chlorobium phaeovibrioides]|uniref:Lipopolysaccharide heptosyltransferase family protein n=1 Tax=Chlorobium phaeovibrioides TaxID=1094 RepID=A0ABW9UQ21_CHLPH|nr:lipopolysaccharide heptosyltransferase family protein [Chlorobium phaeovibrioides]
MNKEEKKKYYRQLSVHLLRKFVWKRKSGKNFRGPLRSIVFLVSERYGDVILLTPVIRRLKLAFPDLEIHAVAFKRHIVRFLTEDSNITRVHFAKGDYLVYARDVLLRRFDVLFNPKDAPSFNFLLHSSLIHAGFKVGHAHPNHEGLFDHLIAMEYFSPVVERNCALLDVLHVPGTECRPYLPPMAVSEMMRSFLGGMECGGLIGINISASMAERFWQQEKWGELLEAFRGERFVVLADPKDRNKKKLLEAAHANVAATPVTGNVFEAGEIIRRLKLLVTLDTSLVHIAACYDVPVVALFRNDRESMSRFPPLSPESDMVVSPGPRIDALPACDVKDSVKRMLERIQKRAVL